LTTIRDPQRLEDYKYSYPVCFLQEMAENGTLVVAIDD
jgi:hypothetical protein